MEIVEQVVNLIVNNGLGVVCVGYMMYFQHTTLRDIQKSMSDMANILGIMKEELKTIKEQLPKK